MLNFRELCEIALNERASDIILSANTPISLRVDGEVVQMNKKKLSPEECRNIIESLLTEKQKSILLRRKELDFSYSITGLSRFRVNAYLQKGTLAASIRPISIFLPKFSKLNLPPIIEKLAFTHSGLILITGPTGSGKSTTLAAMIDLINSRRKCHIITIEDPIEFHHENKQSIVEQREIHVDTESFSAALTSVVRQTPDVIMIGELRDLETISTAITAAETGHLVLSTLHTIDAAQTIHRIIDVFPPMQQTQIRTQLAGALNSVISQQLVPRGYKKGRIPAVEILISTSAIRNLIVNDEVRQIPTAISTGKEQGMQSLNQSLKALLKKGFINFDIARAYSNSPTEFTNSILADLEPSLKKKPNLKYILKNLLYRLKIIKNRKTTGKKSAKIN
ncbi:MAG: hypothetical protein A2452_05770 [Candidatus Firestonebacteria bacterium RIFOXYC2_FULL_39_67]|nr:MAG: hypothetical protein A2536_11845 [Candidatus Firestonebacteria bacterium RIFOXYD2_FULL_39_29]OGF56582.1 MAG: hypothetical protein A2452_05770 [Candidatus Firestonebacteria bacterium RIFOXYC2_FULL_39_67]